MPASRLRVTAQTLNVRAEPSLTGEVIGYLHQNDIVTSLDISADQYWYKVKKDQLTGWASHKYLLAVPPAPAAEPFPWLAIARAELGTREVAGAGDNPRIVAYLKSTTLPAPANANDETAWCSAFANWCVEQADYAGTDSAWARSWLHWGKATTTPQPGCITVFSRDTNSGHVAFFLEETATHVKVLGGNQGNAVSIAQYPKSRLLGYRIPG